jgi:hypothetical protein
MVAGTTATPCPRSTTGATFPKFVKYRGPSGTNFGNKSGTRNESFSRAAVRFEVPDAPAATLEELQIGGTML